MVEQLTLDFTEAEEKVFSRRLELGATVKVKRPSVGADCETEHYLTVYGGKTGKLVNILKGATAVSFEVEFNGSLRNGIFKESELTLC